MIAEARARGARCRLRRLSLCRGIEPAEKPAAAMGAGRRRAGDARAAQAAETRARIRADIERDGLNNWGRIPSWDCVQISISPHLPQFAGRTILALATERGQDPVDTLCDYLADDQGATRVLVTSISEDDIEHIVALADWRWSAPTAIASRPTAPSARACRIRASTAPSRASSTTTCASAARCRSSWRSTR